MNLFMEETCGNIDCEKLIARENKVQCEYQFHENKCAACGWCYECEKYKYDNNKYERNRLSYLYSEPRYYPPTRPELRPDKFEPYDVEIHEEDIKAETIKYDEGTIRRVTIPVTFRKSLYAPYQRIFYSYKEISNNEGSYEKIVSEFQYHQIYETVKGVYTELTLLAFKKNLEERAKEILKAG